MEQVSPGVRGMRWWVVRAGVSETAGLGAVCRVGKVQELREEGLGEPLSLFVLPSCVRVFPHHWQPFVSLE